MKASVAGDFSARRPMERSPRPYESLPDGEVRAHLQQVSRRSRDGPGTRVQRETTRRALLLTRGPSASALLEKAFDALNDAPVFNLETCQQMLFCPASGAIRFRGVEGSPGWRRGSGEKES
jgi:glycine cleavage system aminomethyltransferase T